MTDFVLFVVLGFVIVALAAEGALRFYRLETKLLHMNGRLSAMAVRLAEVERRIQEHDI